MTGDKTGAFFEDMAGNGTEHSDGPQAERQESEQPGIPEILRARGYRLYGRKGQRYIDFYQNDGFAMAGHRPEGIFRVLKSSAAKGLWAEYPGIWRGRLETQLRRIFPFVDRVFMYPGIHAAVRDLSRYFGMPVEIIETPIGFRQGREGLPVDGPTASMEPTAATASKKEQAGRDTCEVLRWRPFAMTDAEMTRLSAGEAGEVFLPVLPFPGKFLPVPLCRVRGSSFEPCGDGEGLSFSREGEVSPVLEAMLVKAASLAAGLLEHAREDLWSLFDLPGTDRIGPFLNFHMNLLDYTALFTDMLKEGILLPPPGRTPSAANLLQHLAERSQGVRQTQQTLQAQRAPAIIPFEFDEGEAAPLIKEMRRRYGIG